MRLVLLGSEKIVVQIASLIKNQIDSVTIDQYYSIDSFAESTNIRSAKYDRMIFVSTILNGVDDKEKRLYGLLEYISKRLPEMRIVTLCRNAAEYSMYRMVFSAPIYVNIDVSSGFSSRLAVSCVESDIASLKDQYEDKDSLGIQSVQQTVKRELPVEEVPKKQGFFSRMFGGKKKGNTTPVEPPAPEVTEDVTDEDIDKILGEPSSISSSISTNSYANIIEKSQEASTAISTEHVAAGVSLKDIGVTEPEVEKIGVRYVDTAERSMGNRKKSVQRASNFVSSPIEQGSSPAANVGTQVSSRGTSGSKSNPTLGFVDDTSSNPDIVFAEAGKSGVTLDKTKETKSVSQAKSPISTKSSSNLNIVIDDTPDIQGNTGLYMEKGVQRAEPTLPLIDGKKFEPQVPNIDVNDIDSKHQFVVGSESTPTLNMDTGGNADGKVGLQIEKGVSDTSDEADFDASFVQREFRRRKPSSLGDISSLPNFDSISPDETDVEEVNDTPTLEVNADDLFSTGKVEPRVVEKIVTQVVERPVEVIKEVEIVKEVVKEVPKEVTREKLVFVGGGSTTAHSFADIMSKKETVFLLVTGDRRSGVTTTALSLANLFGSALNALYVDFDTITKGSLVRLGIQNIVDENDRIQEGVKHLRNPKVLDKLVYRGDNKFASLISNFGVEVSDEEISQAANALAIQQYFDIVVIDCPITKLGLLDDLLPVSDMILCFDGSVQSIINTMSILSDLTDMGISRKIQNIMYRSSRMLVTGQGVTLKAFTENCNFVDDIFSLRDEVIPWIKVPVLGTLATIAKDVKKM